MTEPNRTARYRVVRQLVVLVEVEVDAESVGEAIMRASLVSTQRLDLGRGEWSTRSAVRLTPRFSPRDEAEQLLNKILRETPDATKAQE